MLDVSLDVRRFPKLWLECYNGDDDGDSDDCHTDDGDGG